ncbi:MAG: hypothetical protein K2Q26_06190 [Bdellovibrionales bacterium]|nr:hypothetical protein [Bdellovibrionales bacterium]
MVQQIILMLMTVFLGIGTTQAQTRSADFSTEVGNGGFAIVCSKETLFYDYADLLVHFPEKLKSSMVEQIKDESWRSLLDRIIENYKHIDAERALLLSVLARTKDTNIPFLATEREPFIYVTPKPAMISLLESPSFLGCKMEQLFSFVYRLGLNYESTLFGNFKSFYIKVSSQDLFERMNEINKASAMLHEFTYLTLARQGSYDEAPPLLDIIPLSQFILSLPDTSKSSREDLLQLQAESVMIAKKLGLRSIQYSTFLLVIAGFDATDIENSPLYRLDFYPPPLQRVKLAYVYPHNILVNQKVVKIAGPSEFYENGQLQSSHLVLAFRPGTSGVECGRKIYFKNDGSFDRCE